MAETSETLEASPADVWAVLNDPKMYQYFVVGTKQVRRHDPDWPRPGATLEHTAGIGPLVLHDTSTVLASEPERRLLLEARFRPFGVASVEFRLQPDVAAGGAAGTVERPGRERTVLVVDENPVSGPIALPVLRRLSEALFIARNRELLRRVRKLVTERTR
jgi:uncharacterized protein YndB with AHSA1/START domain